MKKYYYYCQKSQQATKEIEKYVKWYNTQRIQKKLGYVFISIQT
ncbi:MAG TPA: IS3 family transposase [Tenericutes bacterium]|nr:IS3 family transposase [Mycoplasmatota bacterium]